jgi:hypothetical protein
LGQPAEKARRVGILFTKYYLSERLWCDGSGDHGSHAAAGVVR